MIPSQRKVTTDYIKFDDSSIFPELVGNLQLETEALETFADVYTVLQYSDNILCNLSDES